jgi:hypothetical protein
MKLARARRRSAHIELLALSQIVEIPDPRSRPRVASAQVAAYASDPGDVGELELNLVGIDNGLGEQPGIEMLR